MKASKAYERREGDKDGRKCEKEGNAFETFGLKHMCRASVLSRVFMKLSDSSCCQSSLFIFFPKCGALISGEDKLSLLLFKLSNRSSVVNSRFSLIAPYKMKDKDKMTYVPWSSHVHFSSLWWLFGSDPVSIQTPQNNPWLFFLHLSKAILTLFKCSKFTLHSRLIPKLTDLSN